MYLQELAWALLTMFGVVGVPASLLWAHDAIRQFKRGLASGIGILVAAVIIFTSVITALVVCWNHWFT